MTILFSTFGSLGDLHPYLALALEARKRGHRAILATSEKYRAKVEFLDLEFRAVRPDLPPREEFGELAQKVMHPRDGTRFLFKELLGPSVRDNFLDLLEAGHDADIFVTHPAAPGGPLAAQKLGKTWISSILAPISLWSIYDPPTPPVYPFMGALRVLGPAWGAALKQIGRVLTRSWVQEIERLRDEQNLENRGHPAVEGQFSPFGTLALWSQTFAPPQSDWPSRTRATGFCFYDAGGFDGEHSGTEKSGQGWREWLKSGKPPVVFTLGSSAVWSADDFFACSRRYAREHDLRAIFLTGSGTQFTHELAESELEMAYAPHSELFPRASFVVHQGGIGTTAQGLRAGVPQLIVPYAHDQFDNARRAAFVRASLNSYTSGRASPRFSRMQDGIEKARQRAQALAAPIRAENGPLQACEFIEHVSRC